RETGITPGVYLNRLVLDRACLLLLSGEMSIAEVAERLGFSDQFYFTKYFRRQMDMTPSAYRKLMRRG
ncbi:MAG TPA: helix-turn-helix transcriptional regulator, partial [Candidatus Eisenbergiella stercorigallinarum]|nr:helix-turn-helix transcriptional regulator [Candidatus Eisenbergiella stercorigallinarum]